MFHVILLPLGTALSLIALLLKHWPMTIGWCVTATFVGWTVALLIITTMLMTWNSLFATMIGRDIRRNTEFSAEFLWRISAAILALLSIPFGFVGTFPANRNLALACLGWATLCIHWPMLLKSCVHDKKYRNTPLLLIDIGDKKDVIRLIKKEPTILR